MSPVKPPNRRRMLQELEDGLSPAQAKPVKRGPLHLLLKGLLGAILFLGALGLALTGVIGVMIYHHAYPPRIASSETPDSLFTKYEDVSFHSADGVALAGWWIPGREGAPILILCHDRGETKSALLGLAARLAAERYSILLFDFRGHGASAGTSSFGTLEKRDLIGAIDWIEARPGIDSSRIGILGVGMGAYAAVLAASERPQARCLVLDTPYGNAPGDFVAASLPPGLLAKGLRAWAGLLYDAIFKVHSSQESAGRRVRDLSDRNFLILAPKDNEAASQAARSMYESVPEARHNFKNLDLLPATHTTALYGDDRKRYDESLIAFFRSYLPPATRAALEAASRRSKR